MALGRGLVCKQQSATPCYAARRTTQVTISQPRSELPRRPMSSRKPPPRTLDPEDDRKVQQFLERAAPVVLENRILDTQRWGELLALADELELNEA